MRNFKHLEKVKVTKFPWQMGILKKNMSPRAFANPITGYILSRAEDILVNAIKQIESIRTYFRP